MFRNAKWTDKISRVLNEQPIFDISFFVIWMFIKIYLLEVLFINEGEFEGLPISRFLTVVTLYIIGWMVYLCSSRNRKIILLLLNIVITILLYLFMTYINKYSDFPSFDTLFLVQQLGDVSSSLATILSFSDFLIFIDIPFLVVCLVIFWKKINSKNIITKTRILLFFLVLLILLAINKPFIDKIVENYDKKHTGKHVVATTGLFNYMAIDTSHFIDEKVIGEETTEKELKPISNYFQKNTPKYKEGQYFGKLKGKNLLFVQLESFSGFLVDLKVNQQEITPNLNKLVKKSFYATNFFTEIGGGHSSDAEFTSMTSLYPLQKGSVHVMYGENTYRTLPNIMKQQGYSTFSAHAHREDFWNRKIMHQSLGIQQSWFKNEYNLDETIGMGLSDHSFMKQTGEKMQDIPEPFMGYMITLESHSPFIIPSSLKELDLGELEDTKIGNYLHSVHHADKSIATLIEQLKEKKIYDNTAIVLFSDHDAEYTKEEFSPLLPMDQAGALMEQKKVPFLIHTSDQSLTGSYDELMGHLDILPTILHVMGITPDTSTFFGQNIFSSQKRGYAYLDKGHVVTNNHFIVNSNYQIDDLTIIDRSTHKIVQDKAATNIFKKALRETEMSEFIIERDLIRQVEELIMRNSK